MLWETRKLIKHSSQQVKFDAEKIQYLALTSFLSRARWISVKKPILMLLISTCLGQKNVPARRESESGSEIREILISDCNPFIRRVGSRHPFSTSKLSGQRDSGSRASDGSRTARHCSTSSSASEQPPVVSPSELSRTGPVREASHCVDPSAHGGRA